MSTGLELKEEGQRRVIAAEDQDWVATAIQCLNNWLATRKTFYMSDFREWFESSGGRRPHHENVWGGLTRGLKKRGFRLSGKFRQSPRRSAHARIEFEWERV